jgi:outer membrane protein assembly factor BamB
MEPLHPQDPRQIARYQVLARLGVGGMGQVFLAASPGGRLVALKLIHAAYAVDEDFRARFRREVAAAQAVSGAFTAPIIEADADGPLPWMATAYLPGMSLEEAVQRHGPLPPLLVQSLALGLAEALGSIHRAEVVHRDLKPGNVLLTAEGPRVIDFGVAMAPGGGVTTPDFLIGSPGYLPPEQGRAGPAGDVFSLGAVITFAATGTGPFGQADAAELLRRTAHEQPYLERIDPPWLRGVVASCLSKDPSTRPSTDLLIEWLASAVTPQGMQWLPPPVAETIAQRAAEPIPKPLPPPHRGLPRRALLGGVAAAALGGGGLFAATLLLREENPVLWVFQDYKQRLTAGPTVVDGRLLAIPEDKLIRIDTVTGKARWRAQANAQLSFLTNGAIVPGDVAIVGERGIGHLIEGGVSGATLATIDLETGAVLWRKDLDPSNAGLRRVAVTSGVVAVNDKSRALRASDPWTGAFRWTYDARQSILVGPSATAGVFYVGDLDRVWHAVSATDGRKLWTLRVFDEIAGPPVAAGNRVLLTTKTHRLLMLDATNGKILWEVQLSSASQGEEPMPLVLGNTVYFGNNDGSLFALDATTGKQRWKAELGDQPHPGLAVVSGNPKKYLAPVPFQDMLFVYNRATELTALDAATGGIRWHAQLSPMPHEKPVIADGLVHMSANHELHSFDPRTGDAVRKLTETRRADGGHFQYVEFLSSIGSTLFFHSRQGQIVGVRART